jgi:hypothetical protein
MAAGLLTMADSFAEMTFVSWRPGVRYRLSRGEMSSQVRSSRAAIVLRLASHLEPRPLVPALVQSVGRDSLLFYWKSVTLMLLTAIDSAPHIGAMRSPSEYVATQKFWTAWWRSRRAAFVPPSGREGRAAADRWQQRSATRNE